MSEDMSDFDAEYKMILVGDSNAGKTSLFRKISKNVFNEKMVSTIGIDKTTLEYEINIKENENEVKKNIQILLFDTAGQERYLSSTKSYYKRANGVILLYSIIDKSSFDNLTKWLNEVNKVLDNKKGKYLIFLIGTKYDIVKDNEDLRQVTVNEASDFCDENNLLWYGEYSSKDTSQETFNHLFAEFGKKLYEKIGFNRIVGDNVSVLSSKKTKKKKHRCCK